MKILVFRQSLGDRLNARIWGIEITSDANYSLVCLLSVFFNSGDPRLRDGQKAIALTSRGEDRFFSQIALLSAKKSN